jgi:D-alanyl-D-alanine carboxypeptidase
MIYTMKLISAVIVLTLMIVAGCSSNDDDGLPTGKMQALLDSSVSDGGVPGVIVAVDTPSGYWIGAAGKADLLTGEPMRPDMQVRIASVTKMFTATLVMKLVEEERLSLDDSVEKWLPGIVPNGDNITVRMLLNHTCGLFDHEHSSEFWDRLLSEPRSVWSPGDVLNIVKSHDAEFAPGTAWSYCNTGYYILGMIIETVTQSLVEEEMQRHFFTPLGMTRTSLTRDGAMSTPYAHGYSWLQTTGTIVDTSDWNFSWDWTAGAGVTTAEDMLKWTRALFARQVVSPETLQLMTTPVSPSTNYGYGIIITDLPRAFSHDGSNPGTATQWLYLPDSGYTIFIALNRLDTVLNDEDPPPADFVDAEALRDQILMGLLDILNVAN